MLLADDERPIASASNHDLTRSTGSNMTFTLRIAQIGAVGSAGVDIVEAQVLDGFAVFGQTAVVRRHGFNNRLQILGIDMERADRSS